MPVERPDRVIYLRVLGPLVLAIATLVIVSIGGFHALSAMRAYVGGESQWSKARSQAITLLRDRINTPQAAPDCSSLDRWLAVSLGDKSARLALEQSEPDLDTARQGFIRGGNSPADADAMIQMYLNFSKLPWMQPAIEAWRQGDDLIDELNTLVPRICASTAADSAEGRALTARLDTLTAQFVAAENRYSTSLGEVSRLTKTLFAFAILLLGLLLAAGSSWYVVRSLREQLAQRDALLEANTRWTLAAEAADVGVFVWHPLEDLLELDERARRIYGVVTQGPVQREEILKRVHPVDREALRMGPRLLATESIRKHRVFRIAMPDGSTRHIEASGMVRARSDLQSSRMFGVLRDVTDEVSKAQLQIEKETAEQTARARSEFLSRLSHELRTPLNAILGLAQLMDLDPADPLTPGQSRRMKLVLDSGWHLLHLVDDVLDITSIDAGKFAVRLVRTDLREALQASVHLIQAEQTAFGVRLVDELPSTCDPVHADPNRLQQVFVNLLSNACKYNRRGGEVRLLYRAEPEHVCVEIRDQGEGMNEEQLAQLFQPFKRLSASADVPGTGLGLVVVKLLMEQMGGSIEVSSEPQRGSSFTVRLRRA